MFVGLACVSDQNGERGEKLTLNHLLIGLSSSFTNFEGFFVLYLSSHLLVISLIYIWGFVLLRFYDFNC